MDIIKNLKVLVLVILTVIIYRILPTNFQVSFYGVWSLICILVTIIMVAKKKKLDEILMPFLGAMGMIIAYVTYYQVAILSNQIFIRISIILLGVWLVLAAYVAYYNACRLNDRSRQRWGRISLMITSGFCIFLIIVAILV